jgi:hypothetical protein
MTRRLWRATPEGTLQLKDGEYRSTTLKRHVEQRQTEWACLFRRSGSEDRNGPGPARGTACDRLYTFHVKPDDYNLRISGACPFTPKQVRKDVVETHLIRVCLGQEDCEWEPHDEMKNHILIPARFGQPL